MTEFSEKEESIARAIIRLRELFERAPYLVSNNSVPGLGLMTWRDLKTLQEYADEQFEKAESHLAQCVLEVPQFGEGGLAGRMARHAKQLAEHQGTVELTVTAKEIAQIAAALAAITPTECSPAEKTGDSAS